MCSAHSYDQVTGRGASGFRHDADVPGKGADVNQTNGAPQPAAPLRRGGLLGPRAVWRALPGAGGGGGVCERGPQSAATAHPSAGPAHVSQQRDA